MIPFTFKAGGADRTVMLRVVDATTGAPVTNKVYTDFTAEYWISGGTNSVQGITEATLASMATAHSDGGIIHAGAGYYRLDLPDAATASVAKTYVWATVTGCIVIGAVVDCVAYDPTDTVRLGLTALPNAAAEAAGGLYTRGTGAGQINQTVNGLANVNMIDIAGVAVSTTTAQLGVNVVKVNDVATTSVTTINANLGQTQPVNFTGTGASALVKSDMVDIAGTAVNTASAQVGVNIVKVVGDTVMASSSKTTNWGGTP
jgi:hypothetical protein